MTTQLEIKYDPAGVANAMKVAAGQILATAKAADTLGASAVGAAEDLYGFESAEWKAADAADKAEREIVEFANDLDYLAKEASGAARELDQFGDKAARAGQASGSFGRAGGTIGAGIAGAIGGAAVAAVDQVTQILGEKFKEAGKQSFFSAMLSEGAPALHFVESLNYAFLNVLETVGLVSEGISAQASVLDGLSNYSAANAAIDAKIAADKKKQLEEEAKRQKVIEDRLKQQLAIETVLANERAVAANAEKEQWIESIASIEEVDKLYADLIENARLQAASFQMTEDKAKELENTLQTLRARRARLEQDARDTKAKAEEDARDKAIKAEEAFQKDLLAQKDASAAAQKQKDEAIKKGIEGSGAVDQLLGGSSEKDIERQVKSNRRGELVSRSSEINESNLSPRQKAAERRRAQKEIFGKPVSADEKNTAAGQLAKATIAEAAARGGVDQSTVQFMTQAVQAKVQQENENMKMQAQIDQLTQRIAPKTRGKAQRTGRN